MGTPQLRYDELQIIPSGDATVTVLALAGELDLATTPLLEEAFDSLDGNRAVVLDLGELTFIDSYGLHSILARADTCALALARPRPNVRRLLTLTKSERVLPVHETLEAGLARVGA